MTPEFRIEKAGFVIPMTLEMIEPPKGHWEPYTMTPEENKAYRRAKKALKEVENNPWLYFEPDYGYSLMARKTRQWVHR